MIVNSELKNKVSNPPKYYMYSIVLYAYGKILCRLNSFSFFKVKKRMLMINFCKQFSKQYRFLISF